MTTQEKPTRSNWLDPDLDTEEFRALGHRTIDMIAAYFEQLPHLPVYPAVTGREVESIFDEPLTFEGKNAA